MPASAWIRPLMIAAVVAFVVGGLGLVLNQPRLAPIGLFIGELLVILAAIAWNTPKLPLFSETLPITAATDQSADGIAANTLADVPSDAQSTSAVGTQDDAS